MPLLDDIVPKLLAIQGVGHNHQAVTRFQGELAVAAESRTIRAVVVHLLLPVKRS